MSDTPDIANVRIEFDNGCVANLTSSRIYMKNAQDASLPEKTYISSISGEKTEIIRLNTPGDKMYSPSDIETNNGKKTIAIANPPVADVNANQNGTQEIRRTPSCRIPKRR